GRFQAAQPVRLSPCRRPRHDRTQVGGGEAWRLSAQGFFRLGVLERGPYLFSDWNTQPLRGCTQLVVELRDIPARRAADRGSDPLIPTPRRCGGFEVLRLSGK